MYTELFCPFPTLPSLLAALEGPVLNRVKFSKINYYAFYQGSFLSQMEWAPFKSLFWKTNDSVANLMISFRSGISLWDRTCY